MSGNACCGGLIMGAFGGGFGLWAYLSGLWEHQLRNMIKYTPTSKAIAAAPGICEVAGKARGVGKFTAPYSGKECVYYKTNVYRWSGSGKHRSRNLAAAFSSPEPILIEDDTGSVIVNPANKADENRVAIDERASTVPKPFINSLFGMLGLGKKKPPENSGEVPQMFDADDKNAKEKVFLAKFVPSLSEYGDRVDVEETYICDGDPLYAIGNAIQSDAGIEARMEIAPSKEKNNFFLLCDGTEKEALSSLGLFTVLKIIGGPLLVFLCIAMVASEMPFGLDTYLVWAGIALVLAAYAYAALRELLEMYNGMVTLRNNIDRAKANTEALLTRRSDLIPNLVSVLVAQRAYEKSIMQGITALRSNPEVGEASRIVIGIVESNPDLKSNEGFAAFQAQLSKTEEWIAASRSFMVDSITLYNTKVSSLPYSIFAMLGHLKPYPIEKALQ